MNPSSQVSPNIQTMYDSMASVISSRCGRTGDFPSELKELGLFRRDTLTQPEICLIEPSVVLLVSGRKQINLAGQAFPYDTCRFLITSLDLPASSQVVEASPEDPCLGLVLRLDLRLIAELIAQGAPGRSGKSVADKGVGIWLSEVSASIIDPFRRLLDLLNEPEALDALAPLIIREIHFRLLQTDQADRLRRIASVDSQGHRISKAIDWLKIHYSESLRVDDLAARVQMSTPTFHHHFRQLTGMSPLQYQKWMRLNEAKRLMLNEHLDASSAAYQVGYESPSQFSREYSRLFGSPPKRDIENMKKQLQASA